MLNYLIPIAFLTLFTAFKVKIGVGQLRPFDGCVVLLLLWLFSHARMLLRTKLSIGFLLLLPYFALHVMSAYAYYPLNGLREAGQAALLLGFALVLATQADKVDYETIGKVLLVGLIGVMLFNIGWHISHGYWSGWKRLHDPKAAFTFLPMVLGVFMVFASAERRRLYWVLWGAVGIAIVFSGERKAMLIYGLLSVALLSRGRILAALPVAAIGFFALLTFASVSDDPYVSRQIRSILEPAPTALPLSAIARGEMPTSVSNAAREFTLDQIGRILTESPIFGVGTNAYIDLVQARFPYLPIYMQANIHGEFLRVLTENGIIGLLFYLTVWIVAIIRLNRVISYMLARRRLNRAQAAILPVVLLAPPLLYTAIEASGTRVIVASILVSLIPDFLYRALLRDRSRPEPVSAPALSRVEPVARATAE